MIELDVPSAGCTWTWPTTSWRGAGRAWQPPAAATAATRSSTATRAAGRRGRRPRLPRRQVGRGARPAQPLSPGTRVRRCGSTAPVGLWRVPPHAAQDRIWRVDQRPRPARDPVGHESRDRPRDHRLADGIWPASTLAASPAPRGATGRRRPLRRRPRRKPASGSDVERGRYLVQDRRLQRLPHAGVHG